MSRHLSSFGGPQCWSRHRSLLTCGLSGSTWANLVLLLRGVVREVWAFLLPATRSTQRMFAARHKTHRERRQGSSKRPETCVTHITLRLRLSIRFRDEIRKMHVWRQHENLALRESSATRGCQCRLQFVALCQTNASFNFCHVYILDVVMNHPGIPETSFRYSNTMKGRVSATLYAAVREAHDRKACEAQNHRSNSLSNIWYDPTALSEGIKSGMRGTVGSGHLCVRVLGVTSTVADTSNIMDSGVRQSVPPRRSENCYMCAAIAQPEMLDESLTTVAAQIRESLKSCSMVLLTVSQFQSWSASTRILILRQKIRCFMLKQYFREFLA